MNGATPLVELLAAYGVEVIFGVPGDTNVALYEASRSTAGAPRHVTCRDERSAVFMADCYARLSGKPGVAEVPSGAGAMYGLPGVAEANKPSVPLILLVNDIPRPGVGRGTLTELPIEDLFRPISKRAESLDHVSRLPERVRRALRETTAGRPGAVVLSLPEDILHQTMPETGVSLHVERECIRAPSTRTRPEDADVATALEALVAAKRPLILAGGGANRSGAAGSTTRITERLGVPVVTTITGQGVIRLQVPAVLIHSNKACFGWIKALQRMTDRDRSRTDPGRSGVPHDVRANDPTFGVDFGACDMSKLAAVYGMRSFRAATPAELDTAPAEAFALDEPVSIDVVVESIADRLPPSSKGRGRSRGHRRAGRILRRRP